MMRRAACAAAPAGFELDAWLPEPRVLTLHRRDARADPDSLWRAAQTVRLSDTPRLGRIIRWRIEGTPPHLSFAELFRAYPFTLLAEGDRWSVSGLCGRIWTLARDYPRISGPEEFAAWREPGTVRVAFAHGVENERRRPLHARQRSANQARRPAGRPPAASGVGGRRAL